MSVDPLHVSIVDQALSRSDKQQTVEMTFGELILYHTLLQDFGMDFVGDRFVPLMERNMKRLQSIETP